MMQNALLPILLALIPASPAGRQTSVFLDSTRIEFSRNLQNTVFNDRWDSADSILAQRRLQAPADPLVALGHAARLQAEMFARENRIYEKEMNELLDSARALLVNNFNNATRVDSARIFYLIGICQTHRSLWESKTGSMISAIKDGFRARDSFEAGIALDSSFAELKLGLGAYRYWKSAKGGGLLRTIGLISDERKEGLEMVRFAAQQATISPDAAKSTLVWMLMNDKAYKEAAEIAVELQNRYPHGTAFLWPLAECYQKTYKYRNALNTYLKLRERLLPEPGNQMNLIRVDYEITVLARILEDEETLSDIERSFDQYSQNTPRKTRRKLAGKYRALKRL